MRTSPLCKSLEHLLLRTRCYCRPKQTDLDVFVFLEQPLCFLDNALGESALSYLHYGWVLPYNVYSRLVWSICKSHVWSPCSGGFPTLAFLSDIVSRDITTRNACYCEMFRSVVSHSYPAVLTRNQHHPTLTTDLSLDVLWNLDTCSLCDSGGYLHTSASTLSVGLGHLRSLFPEYLYPDPG